MDKKLNNLIEFKEFKLDVKLQNEPGKKVVEKLNNIKSIETLIDEGFFTDTNIGNKIRRGAGFSTKEEKFDKAEKEILDHPVKREVYERLKKEDEDKADKYVKFFVENPEGHPRWSEEKGNWFDTAKYSHELLSDVGAPSTGY